VAAGGVLPQDMVRRAGRIRRDGGHRLDGATGKAPLAMESVGPNPTDRGKEWGKRSLLVDGCSVPLSLVAGGGNVDDSQLLALGELREDRSRFC